MEDKLHSKLASLQIDRDRPRRRSGITRLLLPLAVVCLLVPVAYAAYARLEPQLFPQQVSITEVSMLSPSQAAVTVTSTGYVIPQSTSKISANASGRLAKVLVAEGDSVKQGDLVAVLEADQQRSSIAAASARVSVADSRAQAARAQLKEVSLEVARNTKLVESGAVGRASLETLTAREAALKEAVSTAEAEAIAARADVGSLGIGLRERNILAPISGTIVSDPVSVGEYVGGMGTANVIAEIVDFTSLVVETDVPESKLHLVQMGAPAEIVLDAYPNRRYRGTAYALGKRINRTKATAVVKVKFADKVEDVLPEMSARVSFLSKAIADDEVKEKPRKVVADSAVVERGGQKVVFSVEAGVLHAIPVKVGPAVGSSLELTDGPPPGTRLVAKPTADMAEGQRVKESQK